MQVFANCTTGICFIAAHTWKFFSAIYENRSSIRYLWIGEMQNLTMKAGFSTVFPSTLDWTLACGPLGAPLMGFGPSRRVKVTVLL